MARPSALVLTLLLTVLLSSSRSNPEARILWAANQPTTATHGGASREASLFFSSLPKGLVPSSAPTRKGHAEIVNEKLVDPNLRSVPSPGIGH